MPRRPHFEFENPIKPTGKFAKQWDAEKERAARTNKKPRPYTVQYSFACEKQDETNGETECISLGKDVCVEATVSVLVAKEEGPAARHDVQLSVAGRKSS